MTTLKKIVSKKSCACFICGGLTYLQRVSLSEINDDKAVDVLANLLIIGSEVTYIMNCFICKNCIRRVSNLDANLKTLLSMHVHNYSVKRVLSTPTKRSPQQQGNGD